MSSRFRSFIVSIVLAACSFYFSADSHAQRRSVPPAKAESKPEEKPVDNSQEPFVIELAKTVFRFEKDGTGQREMEVRVKVQNEAGVEAWGQLVFPYGAEFEKLDIDNVSVRKADGTVVKSGPADVQDRTAAVSREAPVYTDMRQKHVTVPGLRPGDVLEYHITWHVVTSLAPNQFWLEHAFFDKRFAVLDEQLEVNIPSESIVKLKNPIHMDPAITTQDSRRLYFWKHSNPVPEKPDKKSASAKKTDDDDDDDKVTTIQMSTFQSWSDVGHWYQELQRGRAIPDEKIRAKTAELLQGRTTDQQKVQALYEFVAKNFRYVSLSLGQGRFQAHAAPEVMANQYGDCKDKHTLLSSMLVAAGFHANSALMNSSRKIDPDIPSPAQFDHVITTIPLAGETIWLDTTTEVAPYRLLFMTLRDKKALVIPEEGTASLQTTPAEPPFLSTEVLDVTGQVNDLGKLTGHTHVTVRGDAELLLRVMFRKTARSDWDDLGYYLKMMMGTYRQTITNIKPGDSAALDKPFEVEYDFTDDGYLDWSSTSDKLTLPLPSLHLAEVEAERQESSKPIELGAPIDVTYRIKLTLPAKYKTRVPVPIRVARDYGEYSSTYKLDGNTVMGERKFHLNQHQIPAARTQDFMAFAAAAGADEEQYVSVETAETGKPAIPTTVDTKELMQAAEAAAQNFDYETVAQLLKRVIEKEPKHKVARRQLGWALLGLGKLDDASKVLIEQTQINPFDNVAFNTLGRVYWAQRKYSEAETAFRKQIEIKPLDGQARANLGQMLVAWKKYKEAVPELEQAIALKPDDEMLYVDLGRAYLDSGQSDKGIEALEKAVTMHPTPLVLNNVSYNLALSKVQLDKAQQYAERAVNSSASELNKIDLAAPDSDSIREVASIAAYWDTLGWVFFQKGDLDSAEKYVTAAWALDQGGEVGTHLGEILEKRGKTAAALHAYALAAAIEAAPPEASDGVNRLAPKGKAAETITDAFHEMGTLRTVTFTSTVKSSAKSKEARFYIVLTPGPSHRGQVSEIKFIDGDETLKAIGNGLKDANFNFVFPDDRATKVVRQGTLFCSPGTGNCSFIMVSPDSIPQN